MAGSNTKISFPQLTEKHDCDHAASATIVIVIPTSARHASKRTDSAQVRLTLQL
jgi:hypothetical protein